MLSLNPVVRTEEETLDVSSSFFEDKVVELAEWENFHRSPN